MTGTTEELVEFMRDEAARLDRLADSIDLAGSTKTDLAKAYCDGAAFSARNTAQSFRERIPTELHEYDWTPADLDRLVDGAFEGVAA